jgi:hypothetical protein
MDARILPLLLAILVVAPAPPVSAQQDDPSLDLPERIVDLQDDWIDEASADVNQTLRDLDLNQTERQALRGSLDRVRSLHEEGRHQAVISTLVNLRALDRFFEIDAEAEGRNDTKGVFLDATLPEYLAAGNASDVLEEDLNGTEDEIDRARSLELLYLAAEQAVQADEQRRLYPTYQSLLQAEGPTPPDRVLQLAVQFSVAPRWTLEYAADLHDLAVSVDEAGEGPALNSSLVPVARAFVAQRADDQEPPARNDSRQNQQGLERLRNAMKATAEEGQMVLSMGMGGVYIASAIHQSIQAQMDQGNLQRQQVRGVLQQSGNNLTPLGSTLEAGYHGVLQKDAHKLVDDVVDDPQASNTTLARGVAQLDRARIVGQALHPLAVESESSGGEPAQTGPSTSDVLVAVGGGMALGAGAAVLGRRYLRG